MSIARARRFVEAVAAHDFEAASELLAADVETVTPRGSVRGVAACRQVLEKAAGDDQIEIEQSTPVFEHVEGDVIARTRETARWRETGEVAYERDFALRLSIDDKETIFKIMVLPGGAIPTDDPANKATHERAASTHDRAVELHEESANLHEEHAAEMREKGHPQQTERAERIADHEREVADQERASAGKERRRSQGEPEPPG